MSGAPLNCLDILVRWQNSEQNMGLVNPEVADFRRAGQRHPGKVELTDA